VDHPDDEEDERGRCGEDRERQRRTIFDTNYPGTLSIMAATNQHTHKHFFLLLFTTKKKSAGSEQQAHTHTHHTTHSCVH